MENIHIIIVIICLHLLTCKICLWSVLVICPQCVVLSLCPTFKTMPILPNVEQYINMSHSNLGRPKQQQTNKKYSQPLVMLQRHLWVWQEGVETYAMHVCKRVTNRIGVV